MCGDWLFFLFRWDVILCVANLCVCGLFLFSEEGCCINYCWCFVIEVF